MPARGQRRTVYRPWTPADDAILRDGIARGDNYADIAQRLGRGYGSVAQRAQTLRIGPIMQARAGVVVGSPPASSALPDDTPSPEPSAPSSTDESEHALLSNTPLSVEDIAALWAIDLTEWEAVALSPNVWAIGAKHPETGEILTQPLYQTKVRFRRKPDATNAKLALQLVADIRADTQTRARARSKPPVVRPDDEPHALEPDLFDIHLNKLAWAAEVGTNYDSEIAEDDARAAMRDLLAMAQPYAIDRVILPVGNDLTNIDTLTKTTTAGTPQDTDTRYHRMFRRARGLVSWMIEQCAQVAPVEVIIVPGNHDELTAWTLGQVLEAEYGHDARITFQSGPKLRKYAEYGANLIGFTHGVDEPHAQLPQIMAVEQKEAWARTVCREWHVGHKHTQRATQPVMVDDKIGVTVRIIRALSRTDSWHTRKGYVGGTRGAEAFVWRRSGGLRAHLYHNADATAVATVAPPCAAVG